MTKLFLLIKRKGAKKFLGVIPLKTGVTMSRAKSVLAGAFNKGFTGQLITEERLKAKIKGGISKIRKGKRKTKRSRK